MASVNACNLLLDKTVDVVQCGTSAPDNTTLLKVYIDRDSPCYWDVRVDWGDSTDSAMYENEAADTDGGLVLEHNYVTNGIFRVSLTLVGWPRIGYTYDIAIEYEDIVYFRIQEEWCGWTYWFPPYGSGQPQTTPSPSSVSPSAAPTFLFESSSSPSPSFHDGTVSPSPLPSVAPTNDITAHPTETGVRASEDPLTNSPTEVTSGRDSIFSLGSLLTLGGILLCAMAIHW